MESAPILKMKEVAEYVSILIKLSSILSLISVYVLVQSNLFILSALEVGLGVKRYVMRHLTASITVTNLFNAKYVNTL